MGNKKASGISVFSHCIVLGLLFLASGCLIGKSKGAKPELPVAQPVVSHHRIDDDYVLVKVDETDTFSSLAAEYLKDARKDWLIAEFNDLDTLVPGQDVVVPLKPFSKGGLQRNGYQTVPVLAYKSFAKDKPGLMSVTEASFDQQMKYLQDNGFHVITLEQLLEFIDFKRQLPEKSVVITIDDGWRTLYDIALPILQKYGFPSTLFVYTDFIGGGKAMSWGQIEELAENGFDIQCKTRTHRNMNRLKEGESLKEYVAAIEMELLYPKKLIQKRIARECTCLAYPYGETNNLVVALLKKHGYRAGFTATGKSNPFFVDKFRIYRAEVYGHDDMEAFKQKLKIFEEMDAE